MGLFVNTNVAALEAGRQARRSSGLLSNTLRQLSSGSRINRAADDAAGLAIAERFRTQVRQSAAELGNLQQGVSLVQTADGGLGAQRGILGRLRDLALQAANGTVDDGGRAALDAEAQQLVQELDATAQGTQFNGRALLGAPAGIGLGTEGGALVEIDASTAASLGVSGLSLATAGGAQAALGLVDGAAGRLDANRASLGAQQNRFESAIEEREARGIGAANAESRIRDLDVAAALIERTRGQLLQRAGLGALAQSGIAAQSALRLLA